MSGLAKYFFFYYTTYPLKMYENLGDVKDRRGRKSKKNTRGFYTYILSDAVPIKSVRYTHRLSEFLRTEYL